tara:strand:+ start:6464 stop:6676 length:213 start_codon:yes stop_codon:yes gene_type:complete
MSELQSVKYPEVQVQLTGNDGNAFAILGNCKKEARRAGLTKDQIDEFMTEAMAGDYDHLLQTCMKYFEVN